MVVKSNKKYNCEGEETAYTHGTASLMAVKKLYFLDCGFSVVKWAGLLVGRKV